MGDVHRPVDKRPDFPAMEQRMLERWREDRTFERSLAAREGGPTFSFSEGPPTANGDPGSHHVLLRSFKDTYLRYKTMRGFHAPRKAGWDCHGLPVELQVERELGLELQARDRDVRRSPSSTSSCRESNAHYIESWERMTERIGFWIDLEGAFRTGDPEYVESVWWSLHELWDRGLIYKGHKVVPYCPRCGTGLSSHETAMGYADTEDVTATVRLPVVEPRGPLRAGDALLIWTTQPWTLFANCAVAISPSLTYVRARVGSEVVVVAEERVDDILGDAAEVLDRFPGGAIVDTRYEPPFDRLPDHGPKGHTVLAAEHVVLDKGTGLVHTAMAFGEEDFVLCERHGIPLVNPVREDGTYDERITGYEGMFVGDAVPRVVAELHEAGKLWDTEPYVHSYPHCWRCDSKLLYYAKESWYIAHARPPPRHARAEPADRLAPRARARRALRQLAAGQRRLGAVARPLLGHAAADLGVRRLRRAPLHRLARGAARGRRRAAAGPPPALHRRRHVGLHGRRLRRRDAPRQERRSTPGTTRACMPFAQFHYPFEGKREVAEQFPPTFICEGIDQTRGWFYTSLAVSTLLFRDIPFRHAVCVGHVTDAKGHKMSKSRGNAVDPWEVLNTHGADAFRWYYLASQQPWAGYRFSADAVHEGMRELLLPLWTTYGFYVLYANIESFDGSGAPPVSERPALDRWALSRLQTLTERMRDADRRLRRDDGRAARRRVGRGPLELVHPPLAPALLGRRRRRARDAARVPRRDGEAARAAGAVPRRGDLLEPRRRRRGGLRRRAGLGPPVRLPRAGRGAARRAARGGHGARARGDRARPRRAREIEGQGAPAAAARDRVRGRARRATRSGGCASWC